MDPLFNNASSPHQRSVEKPFICTDDKATMISPHPEMILTFLQRETCRQVVAAVYIPLAALGFVGNMLCAITYYKMGLKDSVTLTLFNLAISDLGATFFMFTTQFSMIFTFFQFHLKLFWVFDPFIVRSLLNNLDNGWLASSILHTTYLAVQRSCCIALPFKFRRIFTRRRAVYASCIFFFLCFVNMACYSSIFDTRTKFHPELNRTSLESTRKPFDQQIYFFTAIVYTIILNTGSEIIIIVCLVILTNGLRHSMKFNQSSSSKGMTLKSTVASDGEVNQSKSSDDKNDDETTNENKRSEIKLIKSVTFVAVVFVCCNTPVMVQKMVREIFPEVEDRYNIHLYNCIRMVTKTFEMINCSVNFLIFWNQNSKFKSVCRGLFKAELK